MPYQATAINPRMIAGMFAPSTPNEIRDATGYGVPVACDGRATRLHRKYTIVIPTNNAISTCHAARPNANNDPAVTYPPTLCTSDIQNAKKLYDVHVCLRSGARSSFVNRGAYPGLITPAPARWWCSPVSTRTSPSGWAPPGAGDDVVSVMGVAPDRRREPRRNAKSVGAQASSPDARRGSLCRREPGT